MKKEPRGIRLANPGNLRKGDDWKGLAEQQLDPDFCTFISPQYGIRALAKLLRQYQVKYGLNTVKKIINRYAPPNENNTTSYVNSVARVLGVKVDDVIDTFDNFTLLVLVRGIIKHENGECPYGDDVIQESISML